MPWTSETEAPIPFGISANTGRPLNPLSDEAVEASFRGQSQSSSEGAALADRADPAQRSFAVEGGIDGNDLGQAGWGVIFGPSVEQ